MNSRVSRLRLAVERSVWTDERLNDAITRIEYRFDRVDREFDRVWARFDRVDERFDRVDERFDRLTEKVDARVDGLHRQLTQFGWGIVALVVAQTGGIITALVALH